MEPGEPPLPHWGAPFTYSHVKTFKTLSSVTFVQSRALGGGGGHIASLPAGAPKMCSICPNLTLVWGLWRAPAPSMRNDKLKVLTAAATVGGGGWGWGGGHSRGGGHSLQRKTFFAVLDCLLSGRKATDAADITSQDGAGVTAVSRSGWHCRRRLWNRIYSPDAQSGPAPVCNVSPRWRRWLTTDVLRSRSDAARVGLWRYPDVEHTQTMGRVK